MFFFEVILLWAGLHHLGTYHILVNKIKLMNIYDLDLEVGLITINKVLRLYGLFLDGDTLGGFPIRFLRLVVYIVSIDFYCFSCDLRFNFQKFFL